MSSKYRGIIGYLQLDDFWDSLSYNEKKYISRYSQDQLDSETNNPIKGEIISSNLTRLSYLYPFIGSSVTEKRWELADKLITYCDKLDDTIIRKHFFYMNAANCYYLQRRTREDAIEKAIQYCKKDIEIAEQFKIDFQEDLINLAIKLNREPRYILPYYPSFKQLCIMYEQGNQINNALVVCNKAISLGFINDKTKSSMIGRKSKLEKKLNVQKNTDATESS